MTLVERLRKTREHVVSIDDRCKFVFRRPTDYEAAKIFQESWTKFQVVEHFVIGWKGIIEHDLFPSDGGDQAVVFDRLLWSDWLQDRPDLWDLIYDAIVSAYEVYRGVEGSEVKNSQPGSNNETSENSSQAL